MARHITHSSDGGGRGTPLIGIRSYAALISIAIAYGISTGRAQEPPALSRSCVEMNRLAVTRMDRGQFGEAQTILNAASDKDSPKTVRWRRLS